MGGIEKKAELGRLAGEYATPVCLLVGTFVFSIVTAFSKGWEQGIFGSLAATCVSTFIATQVPKISIYILRHQFREFFGKCASENRMTLVYPHFVLSSEVSSLIQNAGIETQRIFQKNHVVSNRVYRVDITDAVAVNDIVGLLQIAVFFNDVVGRSPKILADTIAVQEPTDSLISFGFSSNECTHLFLEQSIKSPFFIKHEPDTTLKYREYIDVELDGGEIKSFRSTSDYEIGIIAKFKPSLETDRDVVWFICGGLGAKGTEGAAYYLAKAWRQIYKRAGSDEFLCVLQVRPSAPKLPRLCFFYPQKKGQNP